MFGYYRAGVNAENLKNLTIMIKHLTAINAFSLLLFYNHIIGQACGLDFSIISVSKEIFYISTSDVLLNTCTSGGFSIILY